MGMEAEREDQAILTMEARMGEVSVAEEDTIIRDRVPRIVSLSQGPPLVHMRRFPSMCIFILIPK